MLWQLALVLHVLGATVWTGGHLVLALGVLPQVLATGDLDFLRRFEDRFEKVGIPALLLQVASGVYMASVVVPEWGLLLPPETASARLVAIKLGLLLITALLALDARLRIIPRLGPHNLRSLVWHIVPVTGVAVLFVIVGVGSRFGWLA